MPLRRQYAAELRALSGFAALSVALLLNRALAAHR
jgi:hypothetical protein